MYSTSSNSFTSLYIFCFTSNIEISFKSFITDFNDTFTANWSTQEIYGRMDPIFNYRSTVRKINLSFDVPSESIEDAKVNAKNADILYKSMYPVYVQENSIGTSLMTTPPFFKIKLANLICRADKQGIANAKENGLMGTIDNFSFKPDMESGFFTQITKSGASVSTANLYPKLYKVTFNFSIIHEHPLGNIVVYNNVSGEPIHMPRLKAEHNEIKTDNLSSFPRNFDDTRFTQSSDGKIKVNGKEYSAQASTTTSAQNATSLISTIP